MTRADSTPVPKGRILFVDDEPALLRAIERTLYATRALWECDFVADPNEAITRLENTRYSVIVADMCMPGMNGAELLARAHVLVPETVRVMLTVNSDIETALEAVNRGHVFQFLIKPCEGSLLIQNLAIAVRQYELQHAERELLNMKLEYADKMSLIGQMAAGINHDLEHILTAIMLQSEHALPNPVDLKTTAEALVAIKEAAAEATELTRELKTFSRYDQQLTFQEVDVQDLVDSSLRLVRPMIRAQIELRHDIPSSVPGIFGDAGRLKQVLLNLLINAGDSISDRGRISVTATQWSPPPGSGTDGEAPQSFVRLSVTDNGSGMDESTRKHIFEPFFTSKGAGKGTGLGLFMSRRLLEQHHGSIAVQSTLGSGTTFHLFLPAVNSIVGSEPARRGGDALS